jgi:hypothetical protein
MNIPKQYIHEYVSCIPETLEITIVNAIRNAVSKLYLIESEKEEAIEKAKNSKVCDLTDTININFV